MPIQTFPACAPANLIAAYGGPAPQEPMPQPAPMPVMEPEPEPVMPPQPEPMPVAEPEPIVPPQPVMPVVEEAPVVVPEPVIEQVAPAPQPVAEPATAPTPQVPVMPAPTDMPVHMPPPQPAPLTYSDGDELTGFLDEEADTSQWVLRNLVTGETYPVPTHPAIIGRSPTSSEIPVGHGDAKRVISRHHARLDINPQRGTITITDLGSTNKTKLGSHVLSPNVPVETSLPVHSLLLGDIPFEIMEDM